MLLIREDKYKNILVTRSIEIQATKEEHEKLQEQIKEYCEKIVKMERYEVREVFFEYNFKNGKITAVSESEIFQTILGYNGRTLEDFDNEMSAIQCMNSYDPTTDLRHYATSFLTGTAYVVYACEYDSSGELEEAYVIDYNIKAFDPNEEE